MPQGATETSWRARGGRTWSAAARETRYRCGGSMQCLVSSVQTVSSVVWNSLRLKTEAGQPSKTTCAQTRKGRERLRSAVRRAKQQRCCVRVWCTYFVSNSGDECSVLRVLLYCTFRTAVPRYAEPFAILFLSYLVVPFDLCREQLYVSYLAVPFDSSLVLYPTRHSKRIHIQIHFKSSFQF